MKTVYVSFNKLHVERIPGASYRPVFSDVPTSSKFPKNQMTIRLIRGLPLLISESIIKPDV